MEKQLKIIWTLWQHDDDATLQSLDIKLCKIKIDQQEGHHLYPIKILIGTFIIWWIWLFTVFFTDS